ncbi:MAG: hypothetical protein RBS29_06885 [Bacteroidales bacterium]|jgi:hypothetical protein|nr:hypothetical protein [Bacteroidales bacterium]
MDIETLTNHIANFGKHYFNNVCKIVLQEVFNLIAINVDGKDDGGTDFAQFSKNGDRLPVAYQITTQRSDIKGKAYRDAEKSIKKLGITRYYFITTYILTETEIIKLQNDISNDLKIHSICLSPNHLAGLILSENLLNKLLDESNYPLPKDTTVNYDYKEMALHSYTLNSKDANEMKENIYDDSILFVLSNSEPLIENELIEKVKEFLGLTDIKDEFLKRKIGSLFGKAQPVLKRTPDKKITLSEKSLNDINSRKKLYEIELASLVSAQVDLLRNKYNYDWTIEDSKQVAIWIADSFIAEQISNLKEVKASIAANPIFKIVESGVDKIKNYLSKSKKIQDEQIHDVVNDLLQNASNHPLITKLSRASVYVALEGANPISSAKALGANRWSDFSIFVEPTVAIPFTCSQLYSGNVNRYFDLSVRSIKRAKNLGANLFIPYFYINECAGHLLQARKYCDVQLSENELQYSSNAFVANYYALKLKNEKLPGNLMDYLASFSTAIKTERNNVKDWVRSIMTDIQSILNKAGINFVEVPLYSHEDCAVFEKEYMKLITDMTVEKPTHLINHDIWGMQFTNDKIVKNKENWIILTFDRSLIAMSKNSSYRGWIANPIKFIDLTENSKPLSESHYTSLIHSVATYSEKTLSAGARIIDRIIRFASKEIQNWEFKQEIEQFKLDLIEKINIDSSDIYKEIDKETDEFLKSHGIKLVIEDETDN